MATGGNLLDQQMAVLAGRPDRISLPRPVVALHGQDPVAATEPGRRARALMTFKRLGVATG
jgi:hypothetical protein